MSRPERVLHPERSALDRFGYVVRKWRKRRGLSIARLAARTNVSKSLLQLTEVAERHPTYTFAQKLEAALQADSEIMSAWEKYAEPYDTRATPATTGTAHGAIPGTGGLPAIPAEPACETRNGRMPGPVPANTQTAHAQAATTKLTAYLRSAGTDLFGQWQLTHALLSDNGDMFGARHVIPLIHDQIAALRQAAKDTDHTSHTRLHQLQAGFADLLSWNYQDTRDHAVAQYWLDRALDWSHTGGDPEITATILTRKSQLALDIPAPHDAISLAQAALGCTRPGSPTAAIATACAAHGHALLADEAASAHAYGQAHKLLTDTHPGEQYGWYNHATKPGGGTFSLDAWRARSLSALGHHHQAAELFATAAHTCPPTNRRGRATILARQARAHAAASDPDHAITAGIQALANTTATTSDRAIHELASLRNELAPWNTTPHVAEFRSAIRELTNHHPGPAT